jgi:DNA polymerase elongation subunit (family B)
MSHKTYQDFIDGEQRVWSWVGSDGEYAFENVLLDKMIYGDTDSGMFMINQKFVDSHTIEEIVANADKVGNMVNSAFPDFVRFAFNCPESRQGVIKTARETVSDKSLFLTAKRYISHIVDSEGKRVDKLKIQGVQLKKSNVSPFTKKILRKVVDMILDGAGVDDLTKVVKDAKSEFMDAPIKDIATPMGCATIVKAQEVYDSTKGFKGVHWAAKAACMWNILSTDRDHKINAGEKVRLVYIRGNKLSTSIAYPSDLTELPSWFTDMVLDRDLMWEKVDDVIVAYLEAIGYDIKSRKEDLRKNLFGF